MSNLLERQMYVVMAVDYGETCDGKARLLAVCLTEEEAQNFCIEDMRELVDDNFDRGFLLDEAKLRVTDVVGNVVCEWSIAQTTIPRQ